MAKKALVAVCCNQPSIGRKTAQSLMELGWGDRIPYAKDRHGFESVVHAWYTTSPRVDMLRNMAVRDALKDGFSHLVFLDADMVWPTTVISDLLAHHDDGIVAGLYVLKGPPYSPVHLVGELQPGDPEFDARVTKFYRAKEYEQDLVPVDVVGMGCTILPTDVCRQMGDRDWFAYDVDGDGWPLISEDVTFCLKARGMGIPRYMDPSIRCGHVTDQVIDHRWDHRYQEAVKASELMGPTVSVA